MVPDLAEGSVEDHLPNSVSYLVRRVDDVDSFRVMPTYRLKEEWPNTADQSQAAII